MAEAATSATTADVRKVRRRHTGACFPFSFRGRPLCRTRARTETATSGV